MINLQFQYKHVSDFLSEEEIHLMQEDIDVSHSMLVEKTGKGNAYLGWLDLPNKIDEDVIHDIETEAKKIQEKAEILVVIGIGGSYLGSKAIIDALSLPFTTNGKEGTNTVVVFAGHNLSQDYHASLLDLLDRKEYAIVVISKSGTTIEPAIVFRLFQKHCEQKYGIEEAAERIFIITDEVKGGLKNISEKHGYKSYSIPEDIPGRFTVLSPVGLFPVAVAGYNIRQLIDGASEMQKVCTSTSSILDNPAAIYAAIRTSLYRMGYQVEVLANYEPALHFVTEWWKQLFGESEGKENEGLFPSTVDFTSDLHSLGQYIQQGQRILFETVIHVQKPKRSLLIPFDETNIDGLNYLSGKSLQEINSMAALGTTLAHIDGEVPNMDIIIPAIDERSLGELIYFFEFACGLSGYMVGINPFNQPGVEIYKNNIFALLGKPGYEEETDNIRNRINNNYTP